MGVDINITVEYTLGDRYSNPEPTINGRMVWYVLELLPHQRVYANGQPRVEFYGDRRHDLFAILANQCNDRNLTPILPREIPEREQGRDHGPHCRGVPHDASDEFKKYAYQYGYAARYSFGWLSLGEIKNYDWDRLVEPGMTCRESVGRFLTESIPMIEEAALAAGVSDLSTCVRLLFSFDH